MGRDEAYQFAEIKIDQAKRSGARELSLSSPQWREPKPRQLSELPELLAELTQLHKLSISHHQLTALPDWLNKLTQLEELEVNDNQLAELPESLGELRNLKSIAVFD